MAEALPPVSPTACSFLLGTAQAPPDNLGGTTYQVTGDLATFLGGPTGKVGATAALNNDGTHKNNTYVVPAGSVHAAFNIPPAVGNGWTRIRSGGTLHPRGTTVTAADTPQLFKVVAPANTNAYALTMAEPTVGWWITGMECVSAAPQYNTYGLIVTDSALRDANDNIIGLRPHYRLIFDRCYVHNLVGQGMQAHAVALHDCYDTQVWDCFFQGFEAKSAWNTDSQGLFLRRGARLHVEHCELQGGDQCAMIGDQGSGDPSYDVTFRRNHFHKPLSWFRYLCYPSGGHVPNPDYDGVDVAVKNSFEIKLAIRVLLEGNTAENVWDGAQNNEAFVVYGGGATEVGVSDVMIRNNLVLNTHQFASNSFGDGAGGGFNPRWPGAKRIAFLNNLALNVRDGVSLFNWVCEDLWVEHNTIVPVGSAGGNQKTIAIQTAFPDSFTRCTVRRNLMGNAQYGIWNNQISNTTLAWLNGSTGIADRDWRENAIFGDADTNPLQNGWSCYIASDIGFARYALAADAKVDLATGILAANSPLKAGQPGYFGTDGKDIGVDHGALEAALGPQSPGLSLSDTVTLQETLQPTYVPAAEPPKRHVKGFRASSRKSIA